MEHKEQEFYAPRENKQSRYDKRYFSLLIFAVFCLESKIRENKQSRYDKRYFSLLIFAGFCLESKISDIFI